MHKLKNYSTKIIVPHPLLIRFQRAKCISVDFDGVLISPYSWSYWFFSGPNILLPESKFFKHVERAFTSITSGFGRPPMEGCFQKLTELKDKGAFLYLLTSRRRYIEKMTLSWLDRHGMGNYFDKSIFNYNSLTPIDHKVLSLRSNSQIQVHVDDSLKTILVLSKEFPDRLFVWITAGYSNKKKNLGIRNVLEVNSWLEL